MTYVYEIHSKIGLSSRIVGKEAWWLPILFRALFTWTKKFCNGIFLENAKMSYSSVKFFSQSSKTSVTYFLKFGYFDAMSLVMRASNKSCRSIGHLHSLHRESSWMPRAREADLPSLFHFYSRVANAKPVEAHGRCKGLGQTSATHLLMQLAIHGSYL